MSFKRKYLGNFKFKYFECEEDEKSEFVLSELIMRIWNAKTELQICNLESIFDKYYWSGLISEEELETLQYEICDELRSRGY